MGLNWTMWLAATVFVFFAGLGLCAGLIVFWLAVALVAVLEEVWCLTRWAVRGWIRLHHSTCR